MESMLDGEFSERFCSHSLPVANSNQKLLLLVQVLVIG